jgi:glycerol-3-phosphate cytidylyltransferase
MGLEKLIIVMSADAYHSECGVLDVKHKHYHMKIVILGGGSFGTALANQLSYNPGNEIVILLRNKESEQEINEKHTNSGYFPKRPLNKAIRATTDYGVIKSADILMLAVPTKSIYEIAHHLSRHLRPETLVVNLAKGILSNGETITEYLKKKLPHEHLITMKGGSFSIEMMNRAPTLFTIGFKKKEQLETLTKAALGTNIFLDYTNDVKGVELLSSIKNIYAIALGNIDARFNSVNARFLILTKAIEEIKIMLRTLGGREQTLFLSCGIGDISLTGLNDLSRNRTLGLLMGKGFFNRSLSNHSVVVEGVNTVNIVYSMLTQNSIAKLPLFLKVKSMLADPKAATLDFNFKELFSSKYKTVLTYGTFDLLHFGHLEILRRIRELGDQVIVGLSTDEFNRVKGKKCIMPFEKRKHLLEILSYVDLVIPENNWEQKTEDVKNYDVDIFVMGDDWKGKFDFLEEYCEVRYLPRTKGISTTKLKSILKE